MNRTNRVKTELSKSNIVCGCMVDKMRLVSVNTEVGAIIGSFSETSTAVRACMQDKVGPGRR